MDAADAVDPEAREVRGSDVELVGGRTFPSATSTAVIVPLQKSP